MVVFSVEIYKVTLYSQRFQYNDYLITSLYLSANARNAQYIDYDHIYKLSE